MGLVLSSYTVREGTNEMVSVCAVLHGPSGGLSREITVTLLASAGTAGEQKMKGSYVQLLSLFLLYTIFLFSIKRGLQSLFLSYM